MISKKETRAIERATPETIKLWSVLKSQGIQAYIAFWDGVSKGTNYTINYAKKKNKSLEIVGVLNEKV